MNTTSWLFSAVVKCRLNKCLLRASLLLCAAVMVRFLIGRWASAVSGWSGHHPIRFMRDEEEVLSFQDLQWVLGYVHLQPHRNENWGTVTSRGEYFVLLTFQLHTRPSLNLPYGLGDQNSSLSLAHDILDSLPLFVGLVVRLSFLPDADNPFAPLAYYPISLARDDKLDNLSHPSS